MIIYRDVITGDELLSDTFSITEVGGIMYEVDCALINIGSNPSEDEDDDDSTIVNNFIYTFRLQATPFDQQSFKNHIRGYMRAVKSHLKTSNPDAVGEFEKGATAQINKILGSFDQWEFYTGESMDIDGMIVLLNRRENGTPYVSIWKHGLNEMQV